jgi:PKD repeat protein
LKIIAFKLPNYYLAFKYANLMKLKHLLLAAGILFMHDSAMAQAVQKNYGCYTDEHNLELELNNPQSQRSKQAFEQYYQQILVQNPAFKTNAANIKIPVVVHVVTEKGLNGISKAQVLNGVEVLNKDFQRLNLDTVNTHSIFRTAPYKLGSNLGVEFILAKIDPQGNPTEGIIRETTVQTNGPVTRDDVKRAAPAWDPTKYFNVWLVQTINSDALAGGGTILGYAQFPSNNSPAALPLYGLVMLHSQWGKIGAVPGTTATTDGRTATHEAGHCFNLYHTFQGGCTGPDHTQTGDMVGDTPPTDQATYNTNCNNSQDRCTSDTGLGSIFTSNVQDMTENYMSYDECQNMFTKGQKTRAVGALTFYPHLINLTSTNNGLATGIDPSVTVGPLVPQPYFGIQEKRVCAGNSVTFTDASYNGTVTTWNWSFPGGTPSTSTAQNPTVTYSTPGKYNVTLAAGNGTTSRSVTYNNYIEVIPVTNLDNVAAGKQFIESFEDATWPNNANPSLKWDRFTNAFASGTATFEQTNIAFTTGTHSVRLRNTGAGNGNINTMISPTLNISTIPGPNNLFYAFDLAYASKPNITPAEKLEIFASNDCGQSWRSLFSKSGAGLVTPNSSNIVGNYSPGPNQWRTEVDNITPNLLGGNLTFKFEVTSKDGQTLYIDNFRVYTILGTKEDLSLSSNINVFPNPSNGSFTVSLPEGKAHNLEITDLTGKVILKQNATGDAQLKLDNQAKGIYLLKVTSEGATSVRKLIVE